MRMRRTMVSRKSEHVTMLARFSPWFCALAAICALIQCASGPIARPSVSDAHWAAQQWPGTTSMDLGTGRELYIGKCGVCHRLYPPEHLSAERWPAVPNRMASKPPLTASEHQLVEHYLLS